MEFTTSQVLLMKAKDISKLMKKQITDKHGKRKTVWVSRDDVAPSMPAKGKVDENSKSIDLKKISNSISKTFSRKKDGTWIDGKNSSLKHTGDVQKYIEEVTGNKVSSISSVEVGKTYPHNKSNPYRHDTYDIELDNGVTMNVVVAYGKPAWDGNVDYQESISVTPDSMKIVETTVKKSFMSQIDEFPNSAILKSRIALSRFESSKQ